MAINISQAFKRTSANPVDESLALTKAQMLTVNDNLMPSKYFTVCQDDGKIYLYDKTNTVDPATGKFRVFEGGGSGGASNLADLEDVLLTALADGQTLVWDDTEEKWVNSSVIANKQDKLQFTTLPEPTSELVGKIYQFTGTTTALYTHGYWYECKEISSGTYSWVETSGGGTDYTAGDGIDITDDTISIDPMPAEDMDDVIDELPTGGNIAVTGYVPLGTLLPFYGETVPDFFLACDGSAYNKADYPELAKHLLSLTNNTPYIVDGDNTKFKVPDLRGEFIRGTGSNSHSGEGSGANVGVHQDATEFPAINISSSGSLVFRKSTEAIAPTNTDSTVGSSPSYASVTGTAGSNTYHAKYTSRPTNTSVLYCIAYKDIYSNPMNDYSTDEKVVGTWVDGKPLYQKTISCGALPNNTTKEVSTGITNIDTVVSLNGITSSTSRAIPLQAPNTTSNASSIQMNYDLSKNCIYFRTGSDQSIYTNTVVTIQYTKTTDA